MRKIKLIIGTVVILIIGGVIGTLLHIAFQKRQLDSNAEFIQYLEVQRKIYDSTMKAQQELMQTALNQAADRIRRDSVVDLQRQNQLIQSINTIKLSYATIPSYNDVSRDSLRRLFTERYGPGK